MGEWEPAREMGPGTKPQDRTVPDAIPVQDYRRQLDGQGAVAEIMRSHMNRLVLAAAGRINADRAQVRAIAAAIRPLRAPSRR